MLDHSTPSTPQPRYSVPRGGYAIRSVWKYNRYRLEGSVAVLLLPNRDGDVVGEARIDVADLDSVLVAAHWRLLRAKTAGLCYATGIPRGEGAPIGRRKPTIFIHRFLMQPGPGLEVDHIDGDGLNCVRANMRLVTRGENMLNKPFHRRILMLEAENAELRRLLAQRV